MPKTIKIILSILFVLLVAFFAAKGLIQFYQETLIFPPTSKQTRDKTPAKKIKIASRDSAPKARMAIILDDWGHNLSLAQNAVDIQRPLTLSILPHLPHSRKIAEIAKKNGLGVMLHMPMQAKSDKAAVEPHTITTTSSDAEILRYLKDALHSIPGVEGVNNHQGSAATSDERVMNIVLKHLKERDLFFIDSHVIASSVAFKIAKQMGIPTTKRDVFIDNQPVIDAIKAELRVAQKKALASGRVVVIGHDKKATLEAIRQMVPELEANGVQLVLAEELLQ